MFHWKTKELFITERSRRLCCMQCAFFGGSLLGIFWPKCESVGFLDFVALMLDSSYFILLWRRCFSSRPLLRRLTAEFEVDPMVAPEGCSGADCVDLVLCVPRVCEAKAAGPLAAVWFSQRSRDREASECHAHDCLSAVAEQRPALTERMRARVVG